MLLQYPPKRRWGSLPFGTKCPSLAFALDNQDISHKYVQQSVIFTTKLDALILAKIGLAILLLTGSITLLLAAIMKYLVAVKTKAIVRPLGEIRIVESASAGIIKNILVQENQVVARGEAIARIDNSQLQSTKNQTIQNIQQYKLQFLQLKSQVQALDTQIAAEVSRMQGAIASAKAELNRALNQGMNTTFSKIYQWFQTLIHPALMEHQTYYHPKFSANFPIPSLTGSWIYF